jgi:hypothetical protein
MTRHLVSLPLKARIFDIRDSSIMRPDRPLRVNVRAAFSCLRVAPAIVFTTLADEMAERTAAIERRPGKSKGSKSFQIRASQSGRLGLASSHASSMVNPVNPSNPRIGSSGFGAVPLFIRSRT